MGSLLFTKSYRLLGRRRAFYGSLLSDPDHVRDDDLVETRIDHADYLDRVTPCEARHRTFLAPRQFDPGCCAEIDEQCRLAKLHLNRVARLPNGGDQTLLTRERHQVIIMYASTVRRANPGTTLSPKHTFCPPMA